MLIFLWPLWPIVASIACGSIILAALGAFTGYTPAYAALPAVLLAVLF